jgi:protein-disulfide isomerase
VIFAAIAGVLLGAGAVALWAGAGASENSRADVEAIVRDYVLANPEIIPEAMRRLEDRERGEVVDANRSAFETPFGAAWAGAADGDVVLVEFFDYACGYCRKSNADVERLLKEDPKLKVVWREWPVLGPDSELAAQASLAAARQGRFRDYYARLFELGRPTAQTIAQAQQAAGVSPQLVAQMKGSAAVRDELVKNHELAQAIRASGTPTFVVGDRVLQGAVGYDKLKEAIAAARTKA